MKTESPPKHPLQPLWIAPDGVLRFSANKIVTVLLDHSTAHGLGLNELMRQAFSRDDWQQLRQLIGYSHSGIPDMDEESWRAAEAVFKGGMSETEARYNYARDLLDKLRKALRTPMAELFEVHHDDLSTSK